MFRPSASLPTLRLRSDLLASTRRFFQDRGYWEVETPLLSHDMVVDAYLEPFTIADESPAGTASPLFLQTSPEFGMKRLVASGAAAIFQITRTFRRAEIGRLHNPEFTIVEWYRVGDTYHDQMDLVESLVREVFRVAQGSALPTPFERVTYDELFGSVLGRPVIGLEASELAAMAAAAGVEAPASLPRDDVDGWLNLLLGLKVEPELARRGAVFVFDYPPGQAALAKIRPDSPPVAERFELYLSGLEICNGYLELTDAAELRRRIHRQSALRARDERRSLPAQSRLLDAMDAGLPECAGVALGFDRLMMAAVGARSLGEVIAFPFDRA